MTIYSLCESKRDTFRNLRDGALRYNNQRVAMRWQQKYEDCVAFMRDLPIEVAEYPLDARCPFKD